MNSLPRFCPRSAGSLSILELRLWLFKAMNGLVPQYLSDHQHVYTRWGPLISCALSSQKPGWGGICQTAKSLNLALKANFIPWPLVQSSAVSVCLVVFLNHWLYVVWVLYYFFVCFFVICILPFLLHFIYSLSSTLVTLLSLKSAI